MGNLRRKAQSEVGSIEDYVDGFMDDLLEKTPPPISSRELSTKSPNKNMNKTNPFIDNGGTIKQTNDDQELTQLNFNDQGGYLPIMGHDERRNRIALIDNRVTVPGMQDSSQSWGGPWMGAGESPDRKTQEQRDYVPLTDKQKSQKVNLRDKRQIVDQILPGISDPTREVGDGEKI